LRYNTRQIVYNGCVIQLKATSKRAVQLMLDGLFVFSQQVPRLVELVITRRDALLT